MKSEYKILIQNQKRRGFVCCSTLEFLELLTIKKNQKLAKLALEIYSDQEGAQSTLSKFLT